MTEQRAANYCVCVEPEKALFYSSRRAAWRHYTTQYKYRSVRVCVLNDVMCRGWIFESIKIQSSPQMMDSPFQIWDTLLHT